jgi:hypothetical protein
MLTSTSGDCEVNPKSRAVDDAQGVDTNQQEVFLDKVDSIWHLFFTSAYISLKTCETRHVNQLMAKLQVNYMYMYNCKKYQLEILATH